MAEPQMPPSNAKGLRLALRVMLLIGFLALAYVFLQSLNVPKHGLDRFAEGSLKKLVVLESPPEQPSRSFLGPNLESVTLADFHGKHVLLNVWATWCAPCIAEIPSLDRLQQNQGGDNFKVVAISVDAQRVDAESFMVSNNVNSLSLYSDNTMGIGSDVGVAGLPISIFYDPKGREIARIPGEVNWQSAEVEALLRAILNAG